MPTDLSNLMTCTVGGASLTLTDWSYSSSPILKEGSGRTGTNVTIEGVGFIASDSAGAFASLISGTVAILGYSGQDIIIGGLGGQTEIVLAAAACREGGPHIEFGIGKGGEQGGGIWRRSVTFKATAKMGIFHVVTKRSAWAPDAMVTHTISGEISGPGARDAALAAIAALEANDYPWPNWVTSDRIESNSAGDEVTYEVSAVEQQAPLPGAGVNQGVEGTITETTDRDEQQRLIRTTSAEFLVMGDPQEVLKLLRPQPADSIIRENVEIGRGPHHTLRAQWQQLESAAGDDLVFWQQKLDWQDAIEPSPIDGMEYTGANPVLFEGKRKLRRVSQTGSAVGRGKYPKPPEPIWPGNQCEQPHIIASEENAWEKRIDWTYAFMFDSTVPGGEPKIDGIALKKLARPDVPAFY